MRIATLMLKNWACFRGVHELTLDAKSYGVFARHETDEERSNWLGKSSLLEAVDFALHGRHRHRTEDGFITKGENECIVALRLDDGSIIARSRKLGKSTRLTFTPCHEGAQGLAMTQAVAQDAITSRLGLTQADFAATCYFEQRQMARLILALPADRMDVVSGWIRLESLQACEAKVLENIGTELHVNGESSKRRALLQDREQRALNGESLEFLQGEYARLLKSRTASEGVLQDMRDKRGVRGKIKQAHEKVAEFKVIIEQGTSLKKKLDVIDAMEIQSQMRELHQVMLNAWQEKADAEKNERMKRALAVGQFNGKCPVAEIACPAKDVINARREDNERMLKAAQEQLAPLASKFDEANRAHDEAKNKVNQCGAMVVELDRLRAQAERLKPAVAFAKAWPLMPEEPESFDSEASTEIARLTAEARDLERRIDEAQTVNVELAELDGKVIAHEERMATLREAALIFGKQGAQRRLAESVLAEIEIGGNEMLTECGIGLSVKVEWSRDGNEPAKSCNACGYPMPKSAKVKRCERCGGERGLHVINKLDIVLSDRSGAAEDLAGVSLQLAASAWLRGNRHSTWSTALIDEPFGQLDASHRRALSGHLAAMLSGKYGFRQSLVIAHHSSVLDALPGRIEIMGHANGDSSVRVVV